MGSAANHFIEAHTPALRVLAINALRLFEVPVFNGTVNSVTWRERTQNQQLVVYLTCTVTPTPFSRRFNQLEVLHARVEPMDPAPALDIEASLASGVAVYSLCIILNGPVVEGRRAHVGGNRYYEFTLTAAQISRLGGMGIGLLEARRRLDESIMRSRHNGM
jgi:hypothetical protein